MVSKSLAPQAMPGSPQEIVLAQWSAAPANAAMVAFGALSADNGRLVVYGWLYDASNAGSPQVLAKQYNEAASEDMARTVAHRFADDIIYRLGGGINGIAETKIYFVSNRTGSKEIWVMDYDGANQHAVTHLGSISISPRISPDNSRIAFASLGSDGWAIRMFSLDLGRMVSFPGRHGGRKQPIAGVVGGRTEDCVLLGAVRASGDMGCGCERRPICAGSLVSARMCRRFGIRAPARRLPG